MYTRLSVQVYIFAHNFEISSGNIFTAGDMPRGGELDDIGYLLDKGVRVALIYGKSLDWVLYFFLN